jgi:hypothetical protein
MNLEELEPYIVEFFADLGIMTDDELHDYLDTVLGVMEYAMMLLLWLSAMHWMKNQLRVSQSFWRDLRD